MLEYRVSARRVDAHGSQATTKNATIVLDTALDGRPDAFNPALRLGCYCPGWDTRHAVPGPRPLFWGCANKGPRARG